MSEKQRELLADLYYIIEYAKSLRKGVMEHGTPTSPELCYAERMKTLSEKVCNTVNNWQAGEK